MESGSWKSSSRYSTMELPTAMPPEPSTLGRDWMVSLISGGARWRSGHRCFPSRVTVASSHHAAVAVAAVAAGAAVAAVSRWPGSSAQPVLPRRSAWAVARSAGSFGHHPSTRAHRRSGHCNRRGPRCPRGCPQHKNAANAPMMAIDITSDTGQMCFLVLLLI